MANALIANAGHSQQSDTSGTVPPPGSGRRGKKIGIVAGCVLLTLAAAFVLRPHSPTMKEMGVNRTITSADNTTIAYTKLGSGPPLILVDGAFCYRENGPAPQLAPLLAEHFTVFTYDRRGRGASGDAPQYSVEREVEDLRSLVREAGGSAFAVGVSSGGGLALQAAARGVNLKALVLYEPPFIEKNGHPPSYAVQKKRLHDLVAAGDRAGAVRFFMSDIYGAPRAFVAIMPIVMWSAWKKNQSVAHTLEYDLTLLEDRSVLGERSTSITVPVLVVGGEKSPAPLKDAVATVTRALPDARSVYLKGQDHYISAPALAPVVVEFFNAPHAASTPR
jgi:pimeloyl-ACP methyl ester carboxylesterase